MNVSQTSFEHLTKLFGAQRKVTLATHSPTDAPGAYFEQASPGLNAYKGGGGKPKYLPTDC